MLVLGIFTMFATANTHTIPVNFLWENQSLIGYSSVKTNSTLETPADAVKMPRKIPVFLLVYSTFVIGFLISSALTLGIHRSLRRQLKTTQRTLKERETEIQQFQKNDHSGMLTESESSSLPILPT